MKKRYIVATTLGLALTVLGLKKLRISRKEELVEEFLFDNGHIYLNKLVIEYGDKLVEEGKLDIVYFTDLDLFGEKPDNLTGVYHGWGFLGEDSLKVAVTFVNGEVIGELIQVIT